MSEPFHLDFELMARYAERSADAIDREIVETHAEDCEQCRGELDDLVAYAAPRRNQWSGGLQPTDGNGRAEARRSTGRSPIRWLAVAAAFVAVIAAGALMLRPRDGDRHLHIPALAGELAASELRLRGAPKGAHAIEPLSPVGTMLLGDRPLFQWAGPRARYRVEVFDEAFHPVAASPELTSTSWRPPHPLPGGKTYVWQITATIDGAAVTFPAPPAPEARFHVIDRTKAREIAALEVREERPSVTLGAAYAEAGALAEAQRELSAALAANRNALLAERFLRDVQLHTP